MFGDFVAADDSDDRDDDGGVVIELLFIGFKLISLFGRHLGNKIEIFSFKLDDRSNFCTLVVAMALDGSDVDGVLLSSEIVVLTIF